MTTPTCCGTSSGSCALGTQPTTASAAWARRARHAPCSRNSRRPARRSPWCSPARSSRRHPARSCWRTCRACSRTPSAFCSSGGATSVIRTPATPSSRRSPAAAWTSTWCGPHLPRTSSSTRRSPASCSRGQRPGVALRTRSTWSGRPGPAAPTSCARCSDAARCRTGSGWPAPRRGAPSSLMRAYGGSRSSSCRTAGSWRTPATRTSRGRRGRRSTRPGTGTTS
jgi:hypothetical protein